MKKARGFSKFIIRVFIVLLVVILASSFMTGLSGCSTASMNCKAVIVSSEDFYANQDNWLTKNSSVISKAVSSADSESVIIGEEYFFVLSATCSAGDTFSMDSGIVIECPDAELTNFSLKGLGSYSLDDGYEEYSDDLLTIVTASVNDGYIEIEPIYYDYFTGTLSFYMAIGFKVNSECDVSISYNVNITNMKYSYTIYHGKYYSQDVYTATSLTAETGEQTKTARALYEKQVKLNSLSVGYIESEYFNDGDFDDSNLKNSVSLSTGGYVYMVIDFEMEGVYENTDNDKITLEVSLSPDKYCSGRLIDANTGTFSEQTAGGARIVNATYSVPEYGKTRIERIIIGIEALNAGEIEVSLSFYNHDVGVSATGNIKYNDTITIN